MRSDPSAHEIDILMGRVLRDNRVISGVTQKRLARHARISFQQIQKYESGSNRISVSRLFELSSALDVKASDLMITVEKLLETAENQASRRRRKSGADVSHARLRALQLLSTIDDYVVLEAVSTLLELFSQSDHRLNCESGEQEQHD